MHTQSKYIVHKLNLLTSSRSTFIIIGTSNAITYIYLPTYPTRNHPICSKSKDFIKWNAFSNLEFENSRVK